MKKGMQTVAVVMMMMVSGMVAQTYGQEKSISADTVVNPAQGILERVQMLPASSIEKRLPRQKFETWLQRVMGTRAELTWQISDCGTPLEAQQDLSTPLPTCIEAEGALPDGRTIVVVLDASSMTEKTGSPKVQWISIEDADGNVDVQSLRDLQRIMRVKR